MVGDEEDGDGVAGQVVAEFFAEAFAGGAIEGREGFVEEEDAGLDGEGSGEGGALLFAAGDLTRVAIGEGGDAPGFQEGLDAAIAFMRSQALEAEGDVLGDGEVGEEGAILEEESDASLLGGKVDVGGGPDFVLEGDLAGVDAFQSGEGAEGGGFSFAGFSEEDGDGEFARGSAEGDLNGRSSRPVLDDVGLPRRHQVPGRYFWRRWKRRRMASEPTSMQKEVIPAAR